MSEQSETEERKPTYVTLDVATFDAQIDAAEARLVALRNEYDRLLSQAQFETDEAREHLEILRMAKKLVVESAHKVDHVTPAAINVDNLTRPVPSTTGHLVPKGNGILRSEADTGNFLQGLDTKTAVLKMLQVDPARAYALQALHDAMRRRGFQGTHNAVHVAVSRIRRDGGPIKRVRSGVYQYDERGTKADFDAKDSG